MLPPQFADRFSELFQKAGVPAQHPPQIFLSMLRHIFERFEGSVLSDADADVVLELLRYVVREKHTSPVALSGQNRLLPVTALLFVDNSRLEVPVCLSVSVFF